MGLPPASTLEGNEPTSSAAGAAVEPDGNEWQRDCPTSFDFQGMQVNLFQKEDDSPAVQTASSKGVEPRTIKRSSLRWSDLEDDEDSDAWPKLPVNNHMLGQNGEILWAWDVASATNSDVPEEEIRLERRNGGYPMSEPPRTRHPTRVQRQLRREGKPWNERQSRPMRHHTKKDVQLPPRPCHQNEPPPVEEQEVKELKHEIRTRHLQAVERDHLPTRFHREDQRQALSKEMQEGAQQMYEGWGNKKRMSTVLAAMEELPKRVGEDMHKLASHVVDSVQSEINEVSTVIRGESAQSSETTKAMKHLEVIPTMVLNLLESRMEKAKAQVREKVGGMIQQLSAIHEEDHEGGEELAEQMQDMSSEVAKIAGDAVEAAAQECRAHATQQLDIALASLREPREEDDEQEEEEAALKWKKVCKIRNAVEDDLLLQKNVETIFPAATHNAMDTALAVIKDKDFMPHSVTNEVVADQLLRAKVRGRGDVRAPSSVNSGGVMVPERAPCAAQPTNPGSFGHPDLCPRPCIYFRTGTCTSGVDCTFCHMPHSKRPLRLDKRHREALKRMPFRKLLKVVVPILASKVSLLTEERLASLCEVPVETEVAQELSPILTEADMDRVNMKEIKTDVLQILEQLAHNAGLPQSFPDGSANSSLWSGRGDLRRASRTSGVSTASTGSSSSEPDSGRDKKVRLKALQVMNLRSLLVMIRKLARDTGSTEDLQFLEDIIARIQSAFGNSAPEFEEDEPDRFETPAVKEDEPLDFPVNSSYAANTNPAQTKPPVVQLRLSQLVS